MNQTIGYPSSSSLREHRRGPASATDLNCASSTSIDSPGGPGALNVEIGDIGYAAGYYNNWLTGTNSMDWNISDKDQVRGRYLYSKNTQIDIAGQIPTFWTPLPQRFHVFTFSEYHNFTPNLTNEVRVGFNRFSQTFTDGGFSFPGTDSVSQPDCGFLRGQRCTDRS